MNVRSLAGRLIGAVAAVYCALAVAAGAYAAHGLQGLAQARLRDAGSYLLLTGIGVIALQAHQRSRMLHGASWTLLLGAALFSGSLAAAALFGLSTRLAPAGGMLMMAGWLLAGWGLWRASPR